MKLDEKLIEEIEKIVVSCNAELFDVKYFFSGKTAILRIFADTKDRITLDECSAISRKLSDYLDEIDFSNGAYTLEVSSPGITRVLESVKDFERVIGKDVSVRYKDEDKKSRKKVGTLKSACSEKLVFEDGEEIKFGAILNGKLTINI